MQAEDYQQLTMQQCAPEYKKIIENFICPICTLVIEDIIQCAECEGVMCEHCLDSWRVKSTTCPLCKSEFEADKVPRKLR